MTTEVMAARTEPVGTPGASGLPPGELDEALVDEQPASTAAAAAARNDRRSRAAMWPW